MVYVSLPPGAIPGGGTALIRDSRLGSAVTAIIVDGGFDPVGLAAAAGDTLTLTLQTRSGEIPYRCIVADVRPPVVVRTSPPPHKRDVPLNASIVVVFSQPLDPATVDTVSVRLWRGLTAVAGTVRFADAENLRAEFHPDTLLAGNTDYQFIVSQSVHGVNGLPLDSAVAVSFTTGSTQPPANLVFASVSVGLSHTCGVTAPGAAYCWGSNDAGQLGNGSTASSSAPVLVAGGHTFRSISAGTDHTCGVTTAGVLYCWGGGYLLLGVGPTPVPVADGLIFAGVSVGDFHACAVTTTGTAYCWGQNGNGELGDGTTTDQTNPVRVVGGHTFAAVSAGVYGTCGVTTTGAAYCWGPNLQGDLGTGTSIGPELCPLIPPFNVNACSTVPVAVTGGLSFRQVEAKAYAACGITTGGTAYCWGSDLSDDLGFGTKTGPEQCAFGEGDTIPCSRTPFAVPNAPAFVALSATGMYTCGLTLTGVAYCWGYPQSIGNLDSYTGPVAAPGGLTFATLSAGPFATCGVSLAGVAYCWGNNNEGMLGDGTTTDRTDPVKVAGQP
jgi:alpha-tubulin suppressor-like RCC1 family protein